MVKITPTQLWLSAAAGKITRQRRLLIQQSLQTDGIYQSINAKGLVTVIGTQDLKAASSDRYAGFLLQTALDSNVGRCFHWEDFSSIRANPTPISVTPQTPTFFPFNIRNVDASIGSSPLEYAFAESCDLSREKARSPGQHFILWTKTRWYSRLRLIFLGRRLSRKRAHPG